MKRGLLHLRTLTRETLLVALVGLIAVATVVATLAYAEPLGGLALDLAVLASVIVGVKHTRVGQVLTLVTLAALVVAPLGWGGMAQFASVLPVLGKDADLRRPSWIAYSAILVGLLTWDGYRKAGPGAIVPSITFWSVLLAITWLVSYAMRASTLLHEAERERALTAQRQALARDLHDTVAHSLSLMVMRCERALIHGGATDDDLEFVIETGHQSIAELRGMLRLLRTASSGTDARETGWKLEPLDQVLAGCCADLRARGFTVSLSQEGELDGLPQSVADSLGKIAREATANIVKHGDLRGPCTVMVSVDAREAELVFMNEPHPLPTMSSKEPLGLRGIQERAEALGGTASAGMGSTRWITRVAVPLAAGQRSAPARESL